MVNYNDRNPPCSNNPIAGRDDSMNITAAHAVNGHPICEPFPESMQTLVIGMGCFWGAERKFWVLPGVYSTHVGYAAGDTVNPTYQEVCTGRTGHAEVVRIVYDPDQIDTRELLKVFWESHDPTQVDAQGNDRGSQYRSIILFGDSDQAVIAEKTRDEYQNALEARGIGKPIATQIAPMGTFYYAEAYHQQYLAKNPNGYCGLRSTGATLPAAPASPQG